MAAERDTIDRLIADHLADRVGAELPGPHPGVTRSGLFVKLAETGADGFVPASTLGNDYFHYDERRHALVGKRTGETYRLGDLVEVKLVEAEPLAGALRFEILSEGRYSKPSGTVPDFTAARMWPTGAASARHAEGNDHGVEYRNRETFDPHQPRSIGRRSNGAVGQVPSMRRGQDLRQVPQGQSDLRHCGLELSHHRADDMPPYIVIMIVGHIVVGLNLAFEQGAEWPIWLHYAIWPALTVISALVLLQPVKGALVGYQWALKMHGFDPDNRVHDPALPDPIPEAQA